MELELFYPWIAGVVGVPLVNWLKAKFGAEDKAAVYLTVIASFGLAALSLFAAGELDFNADFFAVSAQVLGVASAVYKLIWPK